MNVKSKDTILGVIALILSGLFCYMTIGLKQTQYVGDPGPKLLPFIGCAILAIFGIALIVCPGKDSERLLTKRQGLDVLKLSTVYFLYTLCMWLFGFAVTLPAVLFVATFMLSKLSAKNATVGQRLLKSLIFTVIASVVVYVLYIYLLDVTFPQGRVIRALQKMGR